MNRKNLTKFYILKNNDWTQMNELIKDISKTCVSFLTIRKLNYDQINIKVSVFILHLHCF